MTEVEVVVEQVAVVVPETVEVTNSVPVRLEEVLGSSAHESESCSHSVVTRYAASIAVTDVIYLSALSLVAA